MANHCRTDVNHGGFAVIEPLLAIERVSASVMRSAGDIRYVIVTSIVALWVFRVSTSSVLDKFLHMGLYGVIIGIFLDFCVRGSMYTLRLRKGKWKYLKLNNDLKKADCNAS